MSRIASSSFVGGLDDSLGVLDIYSLNSDSEAVSGGSSDLNLSSGVSDSLIRLESLGADDFSLEPVARNPLEIPSVDPERLRSTGLTLSKDVQGLLYQDSFGVDDFSDKRQSELLNAGGLIEENGRGNYRLNKTLRNAKTDLKALQKDCNSLFSDLVRRSNDDWVSRILLYLGAMVKLITEGVVCQVGNLVSGIENTYVKEAVLLLGAGALFKDVKSDIAKGQLVNNPLTRPDPFSGSNRTITKSSVSPSNVIPITNYRNAPDVIITDKVRDPESENYTLDPSNESEVQSALTGVRAGLNPLTKDDAREDIKGLDLVGLYELGTLIEPYKVLELYPDLGINVMRYYRQPKKAVLDLESEYNLITQVMDMYIPNWHLNANGHSSLKYFNVASIDALYVLGNYKNSMYKAEAIIARSYNRNSVPRLLESQYRNIAV